MTTKYRSGDTDLSRIIEQMDARIRALEAENRASFTSVDSEAFVTREGSFRVLDAAGNVVGELGKDLVSGLYGLRILDGTGAVMVRAGELEKVVIPGDPLADPPIPDQEVTNYGLAAVNASGDDLVKLSQLAFGLAAASDSDAGVRSTGSGFGDLAGSNVGPSVTVNIGDTGKALCFFSSQIQFNPSSANNMSGNVSVAVSGASTVAANLSYALGRQVTRNSADTVHVSDIIQAVGMHLFTGLTPGSNTFTMKYSAGSEVADLTVTFQEREIAVFPY